MKHIKEEYLTFFKHDEINQWLYYAIDEDKLFTLKYILEVLGIPIFDSYGNLRSLESILTEFEETIKKYVNFMVRKK